MSTRLFALMFSMFAAVVFAYTASPALADDPTVVDSAHYKVEFENDQVRVLRITYGPGEKSVMHHHPDSLAVFLTDHNVRFTCPDGKTEEVQAKAGQTAWTAAEDHLPENIGDQKLELILVEMKAAPQHDHH